MFQYLAQGQRHRIWIWIGFYCTPSPLLLHWLPDALWRGSEHLWTLIDSMAEAARCWAPRICLRHMDRGRSEERSSGKGSRQRCSSGEARAGSGTPGSKAKQCCTARQLLEPQGQLPSEPIRTEDLKPHWALQRKNQKDAKKIYSPNRCKTIYPFLRENKGNSQ